MSIVSDLERISTVKTNFKELPALYGVEVSANTKIDGIPALFTGMLGMVKPYALNYQSGWVDSSATYGVEATWTYQQPQGSMNDIYKLISGHKYSSVVCIPGTRFRVMYCTTDPTAGTSNITGVSVCRVDNPPAGTTWSTNETPSKVFTAPYDCFLIIQKDNIYNAQAKSYLMDLTYLASPPTPPWEGGGMT